jgi:hypothetical protein
MSKPRFPMQHGGNVITVTWHEDPPTPTEIEHRRLVRRRRLILFSILLLLVILLYWWFGIRGPDR